ncbi:hypothetical protein OSB04_031149 [Centaurea solstitialis]|uniref:Uncharacterized protein n=1 Tax=Centaurea solstitialis TaxID=347529 RepID=A0AA38W7U6_9ASTR|nr:hypothetical protein OSB04_031149 [Centaurea solstitialis]
MVLSNKNTICLRQHHFDSAYLINRIPTRCLIIPHPLDFYSTPNQNIITSEHLSGCCVSIPTIHRHKLQSRDDPHVLMGYPWSESLQSNASI